MTFDRLDNYLRGYRKRAGLTQDEVASLLGCRIGTKVARYESGSREPSLEVLLELEAVFGAPVRELFAGRAEKARRTVRERARRLARKLQRKKKPDAILCHKLQSLESITTRT